MIRLALFAVGAAFALAACEAKAPLRPDFTEAVDKHMEAITSRDIDAYLPTITSGDDLNIIFPDGAMIETTQGVVDFHKEWFADDQWRFDPTMVKTIEGADMGMALLKYDYRDTPDGEPRSAWLALVFKLEGGEWRLVHDQNTRIVPTEKGE